jgi:hypothetical protein
MKEGFAHLQDILAGPSGGKTIHEIPLRGTSPLEQVDNLVLCELLAHREFPYTALCTVNKYLLYRVTHTALYERNKRIEAQFQLGVLFMAPRFITCIRILGSMNV